MRPSCSFEIENCKTLDVDESKLFSLEKLGTQYAPIELEIVRGNSVLWRRIARR